MSSFTIMSLHCYSAVAQKCSMPSTLCFTVRTAMVHVDVDSTWVQETSTARAGVRSWDQKSSLTFLWKKVPKKSQASVPPGSSPLWSPGGIQANGLMCADLSSHLRKHRAFEIEREPLEEKTRRHEVTWIHLVKLKRLHVYGQNVHARRVVLGATHCFFHVFSACHATPPHDTTRPHKTIQQHNNTTPHTHTHTTHNNTTTQQHNTTYTYTHHTHNTHTTTQQHNNTTTQQHNNTRKIQRDRDGERGTDEERRRSVRKREERKREREKEKERKEGREKERRKRNGTENINVNRRAARNGRNKKQNENQIAVTAALSW